MMHSPAASEKACRWAAVSTAPEGSPAFDPADTIQYPITCTYSPFCKLCTHDQLHSCRRPKHAVDCVSALLHTCCALADIDVDPPPWIASLLRQAMLPQTLISQVNLKARDACPQAAIIHTDCMHKTAPSAQNGSQNARGRLYCQSYGPCLCCQSSRMRAGPGSSQP